MKSFNIEYLPSFASEIYFLMVSKTHHDLGFQNRYILTFSQTGLLQRHYCHSISVDLEGDMSLDINLVNKHELLSSNKKVAQWATIAHHAASIMFGDTIIYDAQRQITLNLKQ